MSVALQRICGQCPPCGPDCPSNLPEIRFNVGVATILTHGFPGFVQGQGTASATQLMPDRFRSLQGGDLPYYNRPIGFARDTSYHTAQQPAFGVGDVVETGIWTDSDTYIPGARFTAMAEFTLAQSNQNPSADPTRWTPGGAQVMPRAYWLEQSSAGFRGWHLMQASRGDMAWLRTGGYVCTQAGSWFDQSSLPVWSPMAAPWNTVLPVPNTSPAMVNAWVHGSIPRFRNWTEISVVTVSGSQISTATAGRWSQRFSCTVKRRRLDSVVLEDQAVSVTVPATLPNPNTPSKPFLLRAVRTDVEDFHLVYSQASPGSASGWTTTPTGLRYTGSAGGVAVADYDTADLSEAYTLRGTVTVDRYIDVANDITLGDWGSIGIELLGLMNLTQFPSIANGSQGHWDALGEARIFNQSSASLQYTIETSAVGGSVLPWETQFRLRSENNRKTITGDQHRWLDTPISPTSCSDYFPRAGQLKRRTTEQCLTLINSRDGTQSIIPHGHQGSEDVLLSPTLWMPQRLSHSQATVAPVGTYRCCPQ